MFKSFHFLIPVNVCLVSLAAGLTDVMSRLVLCVSVIIALWSASVLSLSGVNDHDGAVPSFPLSTCSLFSFIMEMNRGKTFVFGPLSVLGPPGGPHAAPVSSGEFLHGGAESSFQGAGMCGRKVQL